MRALTGPGDGAALPSITPGSDGTPCGPRDGAALPAIMKLLKIERLMSDDENERIYQFKKSK